MTVLRNALKSPRTTIAGLAAIACALFPHHTSTIAGIATGLGLIFAADAEKPE